MYVINDSWCPAKDAAHSAERQSEAESSCSNTMIVCLSPPVVRALHQPATLMTACDAKAAHLPSKHTGRKIRLLPLFLFLYFLGYILSSLFDSYLSLLLESSCHSKVENTKETRETETKKKMPGMEVEMETREAARLSGVCLWVNLLNV